MLQKFAMVKYGVFVAKICKHALCASAVKDIWWSPLVRQLLPPWYKVWIWFLKICNCCLFYFHKMPNHIEVDVFMSKANCKPQDVALDSGVLLSRMWGLRDSSSGRGHRWFHWISPHPSLSYFSCPVFVHIITQRFLRQKVSYFCLSQEIFIHDLFKT